MTIEEFRLPDVGEGIAEAEIVSWYVGIGEQVRRDQPLVEIETDKSLLDIPAPCDGTLRAQGAPAGATLPVGAVLAQIEPTPGATAGPAPAAGPERAAAGPERVAAGPDPAAVPAPAAAPELAAGPAPATAAAAPGAAPPDGTNARTLRSRPLASPATRRLARQLGVDLSTVTGTGPAGRVTRADVERAAGAPAPDAPAPAETSAASGADQIIELRGLRRRIAQVMTAAAQVPTIYEWREVDAAALTQAVASLRRHHRDGSARIDLLTIIARAVVAAAGVHKRMNATYDPETEQLTVRGRCDLGIATATEDGLLVPVVRDAQRHSMAELAGAIADLTERARRRDLSLTETRSGTITISNFGALGSSYGTPLLRVPEVTIVGVGRISDRVVVVDGQPAVRPVLPLSVATDHRVNDGAHLAAFCATLEELLADPVLLLAGI